MEVQKDITAEEALKINEEKFALEEARYEIEQKMSKEDLIKENRTLRNFTEKQREMLKEIADKHNNLFNELESLKNEAKTKYLIHITTTDISDYFHISLSDREYEFMKELAQHINLDTGAHLSIYMELKGE